MSTPRAKYAKKRQKKKENLESAANNDEDRKETGAEHSVEWMGVAEAAGAAGPASAVSCLSAPLCRICHDDDREECLISPCDCKGSMNYCHASCLRSWLTEKVQNLKEPSCEICKCAYEVRYERVGRRDCGISLRQLSGQREFVHLLIVSFCLLVLAASIAYTTWGAFSTAQLAINFRKSPLAELTYSVYFIIDALCVLVIAVEFNVGILPIIKKWWKSNLSVVVIDKNKFAICAENLRIVEEASSLLEDEDEDGDEEEEEEEDEERGDRGDEESGEARASESYQERGGGDEAARISGWWIKLWTRRGQGNAGPRETGDDDRGFKSCERRGQGNAGPRETGDDLELTEASAEPAAATTVAGASDLDEIAPGPEVDLGPAMKATKGRRTDRVSSD